MMNKFAKWNNDINLQNLKNEIKDAQNGNGKEYEPVPHDTYEVKLDKLELKETKKGDPMVSAWFTIVEGKYEKSKLFMNQVVTQGFQIHIVNEFLRSMDTGLQIDFEDYEQYADLLLDVAEVCDANKLEFKVKYEDSKGYDKFTILEVYDA